MPTGLDNGGRDVVETQRDPAPFAINIPSSTTTTTASTSSNSKGGGGKQQEGFITKRGASGWTLFCGLFLPVLLFVTFMAIADRVRDHQNEYDPYNDKQLQKQIADRKNAKNVLLQQQ